MQWQKSYLETIPVNSWDDMLWKSKSLVDPVAAEMDCYGRNCDYKDFEMGWLLLTTLEDLLEENYKLRILNSHFYAHSENLRASTMALR